MDKEKYLNKKKQSDDMLNFIAEKHGIKTETFLEKMDIIKRYSLEQISLALTHFCFRNGPIEDMHASPKNRLPSADMEVLNKFCYDKIFTFLTMMQQNKVAELEAIIQHGLSCGSNWDKPEYREY